MSKSYKINIEENPIFYNDIEIIHIENCKEIDFQNKFCILCNDGYLFDPKFQKCLKYFPKIDSIYFLF